MTGRSVNSFDRRTFVRSLGVGIGAAAALSVAACTSAVGLQRAGVGAAGAPGRGGTLRLAGLTDLVPATLLTNSSDGVTAVIGLVYDRLICYPNDRVVPTPSLATSWQQSPDGLSLTLDLRDDVTFYGPARS